MLLNDRLKKTQYIGFFDIMSKLLFLYSQLIFVDFQLKFLLTVPLEFGLCFL